MAEFVESAMHLPAASVGKYKLDVRWEDGVWLGIKMESGESIIDMAKGVVKASDLRRKEDDGAKVVYVDSTEYRGSRTQEQEEDLRSRRSRESDCQRIVRGSQSTLRAWASACPGE